jgi:hypothetical protein
LEVNMRSYEAARSLFGFLSLLCWIVIAVGAVVAFSGASAATDMMRFSSSPIGIIMAALPGGLVALMGFFGLAFVQVGRAGVDTAEYSQQALQISRDHLEVSRQALRHGEEVKNGFASLKAPAGAPPTASYASLRGQARDVAPPVDAAVGKASDAPTVDYKGHDIKSLALGYRCAGMGFPTLEAARSYIDGITPAAPKPLLSSQP